MSTESIIFTRLGTISALTSVRLIVQDAGDDEQPQAIPFCVFEMGVQDFSETQTMCGVDPNFFFQEFAVLMYAGSTTESQDLANQAIVALAGVGVLSGMVTVFEPDLRCYLTTVSFS